MAICDSHSNGDFTSSTAQEAVKNFMEKTIDPYVPTEAITNAVEGVKSIDNFKNCPVGSY